MRLRFVLLDLVVLLSLSAAQNPSVANPNVTVVDCANLHPYQFQCEHMQADPERQQPAYCNPDNTVPVRCMINLSDVVCEGNTTEFTYNLPDGCRYGSRVHHATAMLLSLFFGLLGLDRFYLGYYTIGLIKLFSMGGLFILYFIDIVLIALQILEPADGTGYIMNLWGPRAFPVRFNNETLLVEDFGCADCR